ncbi:MAG: DNA-processing protein DprA [Bacteroidales bacterium]|nr:DNA-processing protein DprA [Bacteroidales bacterium]
MKLTQDALYYVAVTMIPGVGSSTARKLVKWAGSPMEVFQKKELLPQANILPAKILESLDFNSVIDNAERQIDIVLREGIDIVCSNNNAYPRKLAQCDDAPLLYYSKGSGVNFDTCRTVGIVGTRLTDGEGCNNIFNLVEGLQKDGIRVVIVSGLASGADTYAHQAAIKYGVPTAAVLGHGFDMIYPAENRSLARQIVDGAGVLITEYYYGHPVSKNNFPRRNRIVAGLCDALIIVQSRIQGGALITAGYSAMYNRDLFAFPGRATDNNYAGCNKLIHDGRATLITGHHDLENSMGWKSPSKSVPFQTELPLCCLDAQEVKIVDALRENGELSIDSLSVATQIPMAELSPILLSLEFNDVVKSLPGKRYKAM